MKSSSLSANLIKTVTVLISCFICSVALAHHSVAEFDTDRSETIHGIVKEVWYNNPHVRYYVTVKDENGEDVVWDVHTSSINVLVRHGWMKDSIKVGDEVEMTGSPTREGAPRLLVYTVKLANGKIVSSRSTSANN